MFKRTYIGLDITHGELRAASLRHSGRGISLQGGRLLPMADDLFALSQQQPNILDGKRFVDNLHELLSPLVGREERLALSLPDRCGRIVLTEVDTPFKNKAEGKDVLKWKLKTSLPGEPKDVQVDYQVLERTEQGQVRLLVTLIHKAVLNQYEELLADAGFVCPVVDFHSMNLYNFYRPRLDLGEDFVLVGLEGTTLSLQFFQGRMPVLYRVVDVPADPQQIFHEIDRSMVRYRSSHAGFSRASVFLHCDWDDCTDILAALSSVFDREATHLEPKVGRMCQAPLRLSKAKESSIVGAIGAAERMI